MWVVYQARSSPDVGGVRCQVISTAERITGFDTRRFLDAESGTTDCGGG